MGGVGGVGSGGGSCCCLHFLPRVCFIGVCVFLSARDARRGPSDASVYSGRDSGGAARLRRRRCRCCCCCCDQCLSELLVVDGLLMTAEKILISSIPLVFVAAGHHTLSKCCAALCGGSSICFGINLCHSRKKTRHVMERPFR